VRRDGLPAILRLPGRRGRPAALHEISDGRQTVTGDELLAITESDVQLIEGELHGFEDVPERPWVVVRAVDGAWWDVESTDPRVLYLVKERFPDASELPM